MKKIFLFVAAMGCCALLFAQSPEQLDVLLAPMDSTLNRASVQVKQAHHAQAERLYRQALKAYAALPDSVRKTVEENYGEQQGKIYYNLACVESLQKKTAAALRSLQKCADLGYFVNNYRSFWWMERDSDLDNIRADKRYVALREELAETCDFLAILRRSSAYDAAAATDTLPRWCYADPNDRNLVRVRRQFNLDSIAGSGDELSKIRNLLLWVHNTVRHDGGSMNPPSRNAIDMIELCQREGRGVNCRMLAQILNECYLSMGFKSRFVTCMPKNFVNDCHVINAVYSCTLDKWLWVDPSFNAYVLDENGQMLGIGEVRERMRDGRPYSLNADANWNNRQPQTKEQYLDLYMAKNLYYVTCPDRSEFNTETKYEGKIPIRHVGLIPVGYEDADVMFTTSNDAWFWASPYSQQ